MQFNRPFATVTPTLDGEVLAVLASADVSFTTGQVRRVLRAYSDEGIRKVLTRLVSQGVVLADRVGSAFTYRLNTEHLAAEPIRELARLGSTFLARLESQLALWEQPPKYAAIFGSAARGEMTPESDIDILLVHDSDISASMWARQVHQLSTIATQWTGNDTRIVEYTAEDLALAGDEPMIRDVVSQGLTVAGSRSWLLKQLRSRPGEVPRK